MGSTIFKFRPEHLQNLQRLQLSLVFSEILMLAFVLFSFGNIYFNSFPHKLTSEFFMIGFCCQVFSWKTEEQILKLALPLTL